MATVISISQPFKDLGNSIVADAKARLQSQNHVASGDLQKSLTYNIERSGGNVHLDIYANNYADFVERRRRPGKAPFNAIFRWVMLTGVYRKIEKFRDNPKAFTFAVMRNKEKFGTPTPNRPNFQFRFLGETVDRHENEINETADKAFFFEPLKRIDNLMKEPI